MRIGDRHLDDVEALPEGADLPLEQVPVPWQRLCGDWFAATEAEQWDDLLLPPAAALIFSCTCPWLGLWRSLLQHEAHAADGLNQGWPVFSLQLAAQRSDIHIEHVVVANPLLAPHRVEDLLAAMHLIGLAQ